MDYEIYICIPFAFSRTNFFMAALTFELQHTDKDTKARTGKITTDHGEILTPIFMPVGTVGSVKTVSQQQLIKDVQAQIILGNTYHLYLRPGLETMEAAGGLHQFNGWPKPILTDSGGYQVFSLANNRKINEEGVMFQSHIDGSKHLFSPEKVMDIQRIIGGDIRPQQHPIIEQALYRRIGEGIFFQLLAAYAPVGIEIQHHRLAIRGS